MIQLKGVFARHPGAALATFGFYNFLPDIKISWEKRMGTYSPILHTDKNLDDLIKLLMDKDYWKNLFWDEELCRTKEKKDIFWDENVCKEKSKVIYLKNYRELIKRYGNWSVIGTDHIIQAGKKEGEESSIGLTPFCMFIRQASWKYVVNDWLDNLKEDQVRKVLTEIWGGDCYCLESEQRNGLLYEINPEHASSGRKGTIPIICLLSFLSYQLFPCFLDKRRKITALGWEGRNFYYPIFSKPTDKKVFNSWMMNLKLLLNMPIASKSAIGLEVVYRTKRRDYKMGSQKDYALWQSEVVK